MNTGALSAWAPRVLSVLRIVSALLFILHGTQKWFSFPPREGGPVNIMSFPFGVAALLETIGGGLLLLGLFTRPVAFILSGEMAYAYWTVHAGRNMYPVTNGGDGAVLFCFIFFYLIFAGPGPWSVDALMGKKST